MAPKQKRRKRIRQWSEIKVIYVEPQDYKERLQRLELLAELYQKYEKKAMKPEANQFTSEIPSGK